MTDDPSDDVTTRLLRELDPTRGACGIVIATMLDPLPEGAATEPPTTQDAVSVATQALDSGEAPVGGIEFTTDAVDFGHDADTAIASIVSTHDHVVTHRRIMSVGGHGCVGVGESRYGHLPGARDVLDPFACLLPDAEAGIAELAVYVRLRARSLGYAGRVHVELAYHGDQPVIPYVVDAETGTLTPFGTDPAGLSVSYDYDLADDEGTRRAAHLDAIRRLAHSFGADGPQWYLDGEPRVGAESG